MRTAFIILFLQYSSLLSAQEQIIFYHPDKNQTIVIEKNNFACLAYTGYLNQTEQQCGLINAIKDSLVFITPEHKSGHLPSIIRFADIIGFRKVNKSSLVLKPLLQLGFSVGTFILFYHLNYSDGSISALSSVGLSLGVGTASQLAIKHLFKRDVKYWLTQGWQMKFNTFK